MFSISAIKQIGQNIQELEKLDHVSGNQINKLFHGLRISSNGYVLVDNELSFIERVFSRLRELYYSKLYFGNVLIKLQTTSESPIIQRATSKYQQIIFQKLNKSKKKKNYNLLTIIFVH